MLGGEVIYDLQNRHLNFFFWGVDTSESGVRGQGDICLPSSSESGGVGRPDVKIRSSGFVIMLSFDRRVVVPDDALREDDR